MRVRLITLNRLKSSARISLVKSLIELTGGDFKASSQETNELAKSLSISMFIATRDVPKSMAESVQRLVKTLAPAEREHLLKYIHDEPELLDRWPTVDGEVNRLHWMTIYWGLNDPSSGR